jgi:hypothetical protein
MGKRDPSGADVSVNRKNIDFFNGKVFFLLTSPLMGAPFYIWQRAWDFGGVLDSLEIF